MRACQLTETIGPQKKEKKRKTYPNVSLSRTLHRWPLTTPAPLPPLTATAATASSAAAATAKPSDTPPADRLDRDRIKQTDRERQIDKSIKVRQRQKDRQAKV